MSDSDQSLIAWLETPMARIKAEHGEMFQSLGELQYQHIYFAGDLDEQGKPIGTIKIGFTAYLHSRLIAVRRIYDRPNLVFLGILRAGRHQESKMHKRFSTYRIDNSEWFEPGPDLLSFIADHTIPYDEYRAQVKQERIFLHAWYYKLEQREKQRCESLYHLCRHLVQEASSIS